MDTDEGQSGTEVISSSIVWNRADKPGVLICLFAKFICV